MMGISRLSHFLLSAFLFFFLLPCPIFASKKSYVVYLGAHSHDPSSTSIDYNKVTDSHYELLGSFLGSKEKAKDAIFYSYTRTINGFAANLKDDEANRISKHPNVISVFLNKRKELHTTRSWGLLGFEQNGRILKESLMYKARFGKDVIVANFDTGVWPESKSFNDEGLGPVPSRWKGICETNTTSPIKCNRKLIGARMFYKGYESDLGAMDPTLLTPRDNDGHGTHTLSTAAGRIVRASIYGQAKGLAKGGSPKARVASYKVCWEHGCSDADILAAFDTAIHDGINVASLSLGGDPSPYFEDGIAIGAFHAVRSGIAVVCSAGNSGPLAGSASNLAPWIITVAASTVDRDFESDIRLGNNYRYKGESISAKSLPRNKLYPLINGGDANAGIWSPTASQLCFPGSLDPEKVKGKIVFCLRGDNARVEKGEAVLQAGGVGMILGNDPLSGNELIADAHVLPATHITATDAKEVLDYIATTESPGAYISPAYTKLNTKPAPVMASFSSQGPNTLTPQILKPDITAPGVSILAAYSEAISPTGLPEDTRRVPYNVESGTSMSCPHISGIAGLLKALHPSWSPAAIRSAIMTSARVRDNKGEAMQNASFTEATPFSYGAGHVHPNRAMNPGLIYDLTLKDYLVFLCGLNYSSDQLSAFYSKPFSCPKNSGHFDLNYPSISIPSLTATTTVTRRVKTVGAPGTYKVQFSAPRGVSMRVNPKRLTFKKKGEEKAFKVMLVPKKGALGSDYVFGRLIWSDGVHYVRSPIAVRG